jgi:hypothetical protein
MVSTGLRLRRKGSLLIAALFLSFAGNTSSGQNGSCCPPAEEDRSYGPCACRPRGTLFQWSYGTSFETPSPGWDEPLASDRPDFTEASSTVGRGKRQLEMGYTFIRDREDGDTVNAHSFPETLLRVGAVAEWLELRVAYNHGVENATFAGIPSDISGGEDLYLGVKFGLTPQEGILPEMALVPQMTVPTGHDGFTANEVLPGVNWLYGWDINDFLSTAGSTQFNRTVDSVTGEPYTEFAQSWTIGYTLGEHLGGYTEFFFIVPSGADTDHHQGYFNGGFIFPVTNDLQFDVRAGVGLNRAADDLFVGSGAVIRF